MFLLVALVALVLGGCFVAGMLSRLSKPEPVHFEPKRVRRFDADEPKVWDQNLVGLDGRPSGRSASEVRQGEFEQAWQRVQRHFASAGEEAKAKDMGGWD